MLEESPAGYPEGVLDDISGIITGGNHTDNLCRDLHKKFMEDCPNGIPGVVLRWNSYWIPWKEFQDGISGINFCGNL